MLRLRTTRLVSWVAILFSIIGFSSSAAGQAGWENRRLVVDDELLNQGDPFAAIEPLWWSVDIYSNVKEYEETLSMFSAPQRFVFAVMWYRSEVNNGGHDQFFFNSTGIVWPDALATFQNLELREFAEILDQAVGRFTRPPSQERSARIEQLEAEEPDFGDLDARFYDLENAVDLDGKLMAYIEAHRSSFYFDRTVRMPKQ